MFRIESAGIVSGLVALALVLSSATAARAEFRLIPGEYLRSTRFQSLLRTYFVSGSGARLVEAPPGEDPEAFRDFAAGLKTIKQRALHETLQADRRASLDACRQQLRLLTPEAFAEARRVATDLTREAHSDVATEAARVYSAGEAKARLAAFEASQIAWKAAYGRAKVRTERLVKDFEGKLAASTRTWTAEAMLETLREERARLRAAGKRFTQGDYERMKEIAAGKVARRVAAQVARERARIEKVELARADAEADQAGLEAYQQREQKAYDEALAGIDADPPSERTIPESEPGQDESAGQVSWLQGTPGSAPEAGVLGN